MKKIISLGLLAVLMTAGPARAQEAEGPELRIDEIDDSGYPEVALTVTVPVEMNGLNLSPRNFFLSEGDQPVELEVEQLPAAELRVVLAIDVSGSMASDIWTPTTTKRRSTTGWWRR